MRSDRRNVLILLKTLKEPHTISVLINDLSNRQQKSTTVQEIRVGNEILTTPSEISAAFNSHFISVGETLAADIPVSVFQPEYYLEQTDTTFSLKVPSISKVQKLLSTINSKKAAGLDKIPCKLLKLAAEIIAPSLTKIFEKSIHTGIFPTEWKLARVSPIFKNGVKTDMNNYRPISVISTIAKISKKLSMISCTITLIQITGWQIPSPAFGLYIAL